MRMILILPVLSLGYAGLAGCQSEAGERQSLIDRNARTCSDSFERERRKNPGAVPENVDSQRLCSCIMEKVAEGKSVEELREIARRGEPSREELRLMGPCLIEEAQRTGALSK